MFYKNWPYWLKGGIIGLIVGLISTPFILGFGLYYGDCIGYCISPVWFKIFFYISGWSIQVLGPTLPPFMDGLLIILIPATYLFYGVVIGWLYGKIKGKSRN